MRIEKERRRPNPYAPYLFFLFELIIYSEIAYVILFLFGEQPIVYAIVALTLGIFLFNAIKRLQSVRQRNKSITHYQRYQKKMHRNLLEKNLRFQ